MRKSLLIAMVIVSAVSFTGCQGKKNKSADAEQATAVKVGEVTAGKVAQTVNFTGNIEAYSKNAISSPLTLRIDKINVEVGDKVRKGQVLAELDKAQYNANAVELNNTKNTLAKMQPVYDAGGISKLEIDNLKTKISVLAETVRNLEENSTLRSPIDGVVTGRYNEEGNLNSMSPSADGTVGILQVMQMDRLKSYVHLSEQYFPYVHMGMPVVVVADLYPDKTFTGKVTRIAPSINPSTRTFEVEITIPNSKTELRPGMYSRVTFDMGEVDGVTIEDMAIQRQLGTNDKFVYVVKADNTVEKRVITTGRQSGNRVEVTSGLESGEKVVTAGGAKLMTGKKVQIIK